MFGLDKLFAGFAAAGTWLEANPSASLLLGNLAVGVGGAYFDNKARKDEREARREELEMRQAKASDAGDGAIMVTGGRGILSEARYLK